MRARKFYVSTLYCSVCKNKAFVPRKHDEKRKIGHVKTMWCPYCQKKQNFIERGEY